MSSDKILNLNRYISNNNNNKQIIMKFLINCYKFVYQMLVIGRTYLFPIPFFSLSFTLENELAEKVDPEFTQGDWRNG